MDRITATYHFGPHRVDVVESYDDEGVVAYYVLVDHVVLPESPLFTVPGLEEIVRLYAAWQRRQADAGRPDAGLADVLATQAPGTDRARQGDVPEEHRASHPL